VKVPGFSIVRPKNKIPQNDKNAVGTSEPEKEEKFTAITQDKKEQSAANIELTDEPAKEEEPLAEIEEKQKEPEIIKSETELEIPPVDEMEIIGNRTKERINCENCEKTFGTPLFMYDYSEGKRNLVGCCPYCSQIIGKPPNKKVKETENMDGTDIEKLTRLQEKAKKRETVAFHINSDDLDELIKNTAYVR
jgi:hypothetical protein